MRLMGTLRFFGFILAFAATLISADGYAQATSRHHSN